MTKIDADVLREIYKRQERMESSTISSLAAALQIEKPAVRKSLLYLEPWNFIYGYWSIDVPDNLKKYAIPSKVTTRCYLVNEEFVIDGEGIERIARQLEGKR